MNKKPTHVDYSHAGKSSVLDVLSVLLENNETRRLLEDPGVRVFKTKDKVGRTVLSFRSADYLEDQGPDGA